MLPLMCSGSANHSPWPSPSSQCRFPYNWRPSETIPTSVAQSLPGTSSSIGQGVKGEEEDIVTLLDDEEATEFCNFDPTVPDESTWDAGEAIKQILRTEFYLRGARQREE